MIRRSTTLLLAVMLVVSACQPAATERPASPTPEVVASAPPTPVPTQVVQEGPALPPSIGEAILLHTQFAADIDAEGVPIGEADAFPEGITQILALVGWRRVDPGTELRLRLFQGDHFVLEHSHVVQTGRDAGFVVPLVARDGFPAAAYTAEVSWNGVPDELATFTVGDVPRAGVILGSGSGSGPMPYANPAEVLVVTRERILRANLGAAADSVFAAAARVGDLHDLEADGTERATPEAAAQEVHRLLSGGRYRYLLILGNDDAVPFFRVQNPLADEERTDLSDWQLPADWLPSDDPYANLDGDHWAIPDLAVARIPSSEDAELLLTQLSDLSPPDGHAYALINQERRTQAATVISTINPSIAVELDYAPPVDTARFASGPAADARYLYVLLHGIGVLTDAWSANLETWVPQNAAQRYAGEWTVESRRHQLDAVSIDGNPGSRGLVNIGACYGAWTLDTIQEPQHKTADNNLALHYLKSGARAFVADTHLSYTVLQAASDPPLGRTGFERIFWRAIGQGATAIDAFQQAKLEIGASIDQLVARGHAQGAALNLKTLHYMVYLGRP
ncbi:MAG: hypothetical protein FIA92_05355 [Chloroflexi bacterium]|nr:hypothetical protein [Chloroflexota bacterium]